MSAPLLRFKQGDHVCVFYEDESELLQFLVSYFLEGLHNGERCFCAQTPAMAANIEAALRSHCDATGEVLKPGALELHTTDEVYFSDSTFDPVTLMSLLKSSIADAVRQGFTGIRMAGEMEFAARGACECDQLFEYEKLVEEAFPGRPVIGVCQYRARSFPPAILQSILAFHKKSLTNTMRTSNHSSLAIRNGRYVIDVVADRLNPSSQFYYVAQEHGKRDILGWGVEPSFDLAVQQGESLLHSLGAAD